MPQVSKIIRSRDEWRCKAVQRGDEIREHRKTQKRNQKKIENLKLQIDAMEQAAGDKKNGYSLQPPHELLR